MNRLPEIIRTENVSNEVVAEIIRTENVSKKSSSLNAFLKPVPVLLTGFSARELSQEIDDNEIDDAEVRHLNDVYYPQSDNSNDAVNINDYKSLYYVSRYIGYKIKYRISENQWQIYSNDNKFLAYCKCGNFTYLHLLAEKTSENTSSSPPWYYAIREISGDTNEGALCPNITITRDQKLIDEHQNKLYIIWKETARSIVIDNVTGYYARAINGVYDPIKNDVLDESIFYEKRNFKNSIIKYCKVKMGGNQYQFKSREIKQLKNKIDDDDDDDDCIAYISCPDPLPLHTIKEKNIVVIYDDNPVEQDDIKITDSKTEINSMDKKEKEYLFTNCLHEEIVKAIDGLKNKDLEIEPDKDTDGKFFETDEMKVKTMFKMVQDVRVKWEGTEVVKKVLYLTNHQASLFDTTAMKQCIKALDIGKPKFVIILNGSGGSKTMMDIAHGEKKGMPESEYIAGPYLSSEISPLDENITETQILLFMKNAILPLAKQTNALIIVQGANDCILSASLSKVALAEQARLGKECPFTVVALSMEFEVHYKAVLAKEKYSIASQLCLSTDWKSRIPILNRVYYDNKDISEEERCDLTPAASRYIIFESRDKEGRQTLNNLQLFRSSFIEILTKTLPSIAISSHKIKDDIGSLVELISRNIPVLLLDSTERAFTLTRAVKGEETIKTVLAKVEVADQFPNVSKTLIDDMEIKNGGISILGRHTLVDTAQNMLEKKWEALIKYGVYDSLSASNLAFCHTVLKTGSEVHSSMLDFVPLYKKIEELQKLKRENKDSKAVLIPSDLVTKMVEFYLKRIPVLESRAKLSVVTKWIEKNRKSIDKIKDELNTIKAELNTIKAETVKNDNIRAVREAELVKKDKIRASIKAELKRLIVFVDGAEAYKEKLYKDCLNLGVLESQEEYLDNVREFMKDVTNNNNNNNDKEFAVDNKLDDKLKRINKIADQLKGQHVEKNEINELNMLNELDFIRESTIVPGSTHDFILLFDLLSHPLTFSGSIHDVDKLKRILTKVAKIDRLPVANTLESLIAIKDCWDHFEIYSQIATSYKKISKFAYVTLLVIAILITAASVAELNQIPFDSRQPILIMSFVSTAVVAYISFANPAVRWQQLRMAALGIESNIWLFRTRAGIYRESSNDSADKPAVLLNENILEIKQIVLDGADIKSTAFYARVYSRNEHNQHNPYNRKFSSLDEFDRPDRGQTVRELMYQCFKKKVKPVDPNYFINELDRITKENRDKEEKMRQSKTNSMFRLESSMGGWFKPIQKKSSVARRSSLVQDSSNGSSMNLPNVMLGDFDTCSDVETGNKNFEIKLPTVTTEVSKGSRGIDDDNNIKIPEDQKDTSALSPSGSICALPVKKISDNYSKSEDVYELEDVVELIMKDDGEICRKDNHYEPCTPDLYIEFRIVPAIKFYKKKIPACNRTRTIAQIFMILGSIATAALAFLGISSWAPIVSIFISGITAYIEFQGTNSKISRYSFTVHKLEELILWWQTLKPIERASVTNIDRLVLTAEDLLQREQQAWKSTSQAVKLLAKESKSESNVNKNE
jgi:hypothetical protein